MEQNLLLRKFRLLLIVLLVLQLVTLALVAILFVRSSQPNEPELLPVQALAPNTAVSDEADGSDEATPAITLNFGPSQNLPLGARMGAGGTGTHRVEVLRDGQPLTGITAESVDPSVCVVAGIEENCITIQNVAPGLSRVTLLLDGEAVGYFDWYIGD